LISRALEISRLRKALRDCPTERLSAVNCIRRAIAQFGDKTVVSWSGGRCSTVVLYLALKINPNIRVIFNDTGIEFPETYAFIKKIRKDWNVNLQVLKPNVSFFRDIVPKYGFPMMRGQYKDNSASKDGKPMCCELLKELPLREAKITCSITGIRLVESRMRMFGICQKGQFYYAKTLKAWRFHPIAFWSTQRLLQFIEKNGIPQNAVYAAGHERCGCWPCTGYLTWRESLSKAHPKMYRALSKMIGEPTLWEYFENENCDQIPLEASS
jgi:phosphoadenosine phosphosulfate reductase